MNTAQSLLAGTALGGGLVYFLDARRGARRRALVRDKAIRVAGQIEHTVSVGARDFSHRVRGAYAGTIARAVDAAVPAEVLEARVRAALGHACSHPHAIHVHACGDGLIELTGRILESDANLVKMRMMRVPGVRALVDDLEEFPSGQGIPELQGNPAATAKVPARRWKTPAARASLLALASIAALGVAGPSVLGLGASVLAAGALARSVERRRSRMLTRRPEVARASLP